MVGYISGPRQRTFGNAGAVMLADTHAVRRVTQKLRAQSPLARHSAEAPTQSHTHTPQFIDRRTWSKPVLAFWVMSVSALPMSIWPHAMSYYSSTGSDGDQHARRSGGGVQNRAHARTRDSID